MFISFFGIKTPKIHMTINCFFSFPITECRSGGYTVLNDATRAQGYSGSPVRCDNRLQTKWYRIVGASGNQMPTTCVSTNRCGTHAPGWLQGSHPSAGQLRSVKVCFHWSNNCCRWSTIIRVRNCGAFYVYELKRPPVCSLRYCGNSGWHKMLQNIPIVNVYNNFNTRQIIPNGSRKFSWLVELCALLTD